MPLSAYQGPTWQRSEELDGGDPPGGSGYTVRVTTNEHAAIIIDQWQHLLLPMEEPEDTKGLEILRMS